jgi:hypothetical protein
MAQESSVFQFSGVSKDATLFVRVSRAQASNVSSEKDARISWVRTNPIVQNPPLPPVRAGLEQIFDNVAKPAYLTNEVWLDMSRVVFNQLIMRCTSTVAAKAFPIGVPDDDGCQLLQKIRGGAGTVDARMMQYAATLKQTTLSTTLRLGGYPFVGNSEMAGV